ncbi:hemolysin family protein [Prescottella sp. R16]|uniref:hemolysin family protein n=1 Tax=Prescottella sp. R16 TaxID=3064529 RepID=UPI00272DF545|nr:hemolysin family protein [Prescottella sp. R16]
MLTVLGIVAGIAVVLAITALTGYFVAQEFAYMAVSRSRLEARARAGDAAAARALTVTRRTSFMLSGAQLGITVTGLLVGYVAEPLIGRGLSDLLGGVGVPSGIGLAVGALLAILFSTIVQMVFGELFPKNLAIARPEPVARRLALSTTVYLKLFGWLIRLFDHSSNLLLRALKIEPVHDVEHSATPRDLEHIVAESRDTGELPRELSTLLDRILDFPTRTAEHAMIPRAHVDVVHSDDPIRDVLSRMGTGHTRYPVVGSSSDDLRGVVHLHDLLGTDPTGTAADRARPAVIVPSTLPLPDVLAQITAAKDEMALVIDEYGGFAGVVTVEDMAEELVGEIADEHDPDHDASTIVAVDGGWLIPGGAHIDEVARALDEELPEDDDYETFAGLVIAEFGGLPRVGDTVTVPLPAAPADLVADTPAPPKTLHVEVRAVAKHVPALLSVTVHTDRKNAADE